MLEMINAYIKYVYYILGFILFVVIILLIIKIIQIMKSLNVDLKGIQDINDKINAIKQKIDYLEESFSTSWSFFVEIIGILKITKLILRDYRGTPKAKRSMIKSTARAVMKSPGTVSKIKKLV